MHVCFKILVISIMSLATSVSSSSMTECSPDLELTWSYDPIDYSSKISEVSDNLSTISLNYDLGFVKLLDKDDSEIKLYRQNSIRKSIEDPEDFIVRYESTAASNIQTTSIIVFDPICKNREISIASIFVTNGMSYSNTIYSCKCLSKIYDLDHFIFEN